MNTKIVLAVLVFAVCVVSRLFFINSNAFFLDGDEAIVALMGLDILDGNFPLYFYGQNYGLSIIEALLVSVGVLFFGTTSLAVKIPMLILWSLSVVFLSFTFWRVLGKDRLAFAIAVGLFILSPTWLVWSLKARGGYLTSFFFASLIVFLLVTLRDKNNLAKWLLVGVSVALVYESQPIWLPCLVPIVFFFLWESVGNVPGKLWNFCFDSCRNICRDQVEY